MGSNTRMSGGFSTPWSDYDVPVDRSVWEENILRLFQDAPESVAVPVTDAELAPVLIENRSDVSLLTPEPQVLLFKQASVAQHPGGSNLYLKNTSIVSSQPQVCVRPGVSYLGPAHVASGNRLYSSHLVSYVVHSILGEGTYGKVAKCTRKDTSSMVAVKIVKNDPDFIQQAKEEVTILSTLKRLGPDANFVQLNSCFFDRGRFCMEFELLDMDLFNFMRQRAFRPLPLKEIRPIVYQLASALQQLKTIGIIHGDLKLENVMIVDHMRQPARVKIIDFGLACHVSAAKPCAIIQSREYRSPEVMLGLPFSVPADMWSLGCIAAFLFLGSFLYYGKCEYEMMRYIVKTQGYPPDQLLKAGLKTGKFFCRSSSCTNRLFRLKTPAKHRAETGSQSVNNRRFNSLNDLKQFRHPIYRTADFEDMEGRGMFVCMLKAMLEIEASRRISPSQVLQLPFLNKYSSSDLDTVSPRDVVQRHITCQPCNSPRSQREARARTKRQRVKVETEKTDLSNEKKKKRMDLRQKGQRNSNTSLLTSNTQTEQTALRRARVGGNVEGRRAKAEPQARRVSTRTKIKAATDQPPQANVCIKVVKRRTTRAVTKKQGNTWPVAVSHHKHDATPGTFPPSCGLLQSSVITLRRPKTLGRP